MKPLSLYRTVWIVLLLMTFYPAIGIPKEHDTNFHYDHAKVFLSDGTVIPVEIADTEKKRNRGLGFRSSLRQGWGMLFVFDSKKPHGFWMKDMHFPIDIIWLDNYRIVHIEHSVPPPVPGESSPPVFTPPSASNFVLEIAEGQSEALHLKVGQTLRYEF